MNSNRAANSVKLFIDVLGLEDARMEERLEEKLFSEYGPSDHRMILIPSDKTIHRVFFSFDRLVEIGNVPKLREKEVSTKMVVGFVDNRRVVVESARASGAFEDVIQFNNGRILFLPGTDPDYMTEESQEFFLSVRNTYRAQVRSMCRLRKQSGL